MSAPIVVYLLICGLNIGNPEIQANYLLRNGDACQGILRNVTQIYPEKSCFCMPAIISGDDRDAVPGIEEHPQE
jgi:hypothetical protein